MRKTWPECGSCDANLDGEFNTSDLIAVFKAGEYEDRIIANSTWATGDWNGDMEFDSGDFVTLSKAPVLNKGRAPPFNPSLNHPV